MMTAQPTLRLCHTGMDSRSLYAFEIFLSRVDTRACQITDEAAADVAFIDIDNDLGAYLLAGHRLLYPGRPLIVSALSPRLADDPLTVAVTKPVGLAAFSAALEQVRRLLPAEIVDAEKQGFSSPDATWFKGESIDYVRRRIVNRRARIYDYLDFDAVQSLVDDHLSGRQNRRLLIWSLLNVEGLLERYFS